MTSRPDRRARDRRRRRFAQQINAMLDAANADDKPWSIHGLTDAGADCDSIATIHGTPGSGVILADIAHDDSCPAYHGVIPWTVA